MSCGRSINQTKECMNAGERMKSTPNAYRTPTVDLFSPPSDFQTPGPVQEDEKKRRDQKHTHTAQQ